MAHGEAHGGRPLADEVGGGDLAWLGLRQTDFPTPAPGDLPAGNPLGPSTTCDLYSNNTQPAKKTRERHYDQWIYLGQDKNKRADAREQIGAPVLVRRLAITYPLAKTRPTVSGANPLSIARRTGESLARSQNCTTK